MGDDHRHWRDPALGELTEFDTRGGRMQAYSAGSGEPIVFVHGALVNANLWRKVVARLSPDFRCIALEMPLGAHRLPMPEADASPTGLADLIGDAIDALGLTAPTIVANDTGGGLTQIAISRRPDLAGKVVLTSCDAYDNFPPRLFRWLLAPLRWPAFARGAFAPLRMRALHNSPLAFGWLTHSKIQPEATDSYLLPVLTEPGITEDISRFIRTVDPRYTLEAIEKLRSYERPVLLAWSRDDRFFPPAHAERLAADIPGARVEWVENARTFSSEDNPERLAELIAGFVREPVATAA